MISTKEISFQLKYPLAMGVKSYKVIPGTTYIKPGIEMPTTSVYLVPHPNLCMI